METIHPTPPPDATGSAAPNTQPPGEPTLDAHGAPTHGPAADDSAQALRLHYLFRRTTQQPHVLQKALYSYRGVNQP
jgi:hypothetical protein